MNHRSIFYTRDLGLYKFSRVLGGIPLELKIQIWRYILFDNYNLKEIVTILGSNSVLDRIILDYFTINTLIISRYLANNTFIRIIGVKGKLLISSSESEKLFRLVLSGEYHVQKLCFQGEIQKTLELSSKLSKLVYLADLLVDVHYHQLLEYPNWDTTLGDKVKSLSLSSSDNISFLKLSDLKLQKLSLSLYQYPIKLKNISKILHFAVKLKTLEQLDIVIVIEKNFALPDCLIEALRIVSSTSIKVQISILDNNLTFKNMQFDWFESKIKPVLRYVTDLSMNLSSEGFIDLHSLVSCVNLRNLKISLYYSLNKAGNFTIRQERLESLELYYFDRHMHYSLNKLSNLSKLILNASDISNEIINGLPNTLKHLELINCYMKSSNVNLILPSKLKRFHYEMTALKQSFPFFENFKSLDSLQKLSIVLSKEIPNDFLLQLPANLSLFYIRCENTETPIDWGLMNFSDLKIGTFHLAGACNEYDLSYLPRSLTRLNFEIRTHFFINKLPSLLESLNITITDPKIPLFVFLNDIMSGIRSLQQLTLSSNILNYEMTKFDFMSLKLFKLIIVHNTLNVENKSKAIVKIGSIGDKLSKFEIVSNTLETQLIASKITTNIRSSGILDCVTSFRESDTGKLKIEKSMSKLKIDSSKKKLNLRKLISRKK